MSTESSTPKAISDPWLTASELGKELSWTPRWAKIQINAGLFGEIGDGSTDTPVKRVPYDGGIGGYRFYVRRSAIDAYRNRQMQQREAARG